MYSLTPIEDRLLLDLSSDDLFRKLCTLSKIDRWCCRHSFAVEIAGLGRSEAEDRASPAPYHWISA